MVKYIRVIANQISVMGIFSVMISWRHFLNSQNSKLIYKVLLLLASVSPGIAIETMAQTCTAPINSTGTTVCSSGVTIYPAFSGANFKWYRVGTIEMIAQNVSSITVAPGSGTGSYYCKATLSGCGELTSNTITITDISPVASISPVGSTQICVGSSGVTLTADSYNSNNNYKWYKDGVYTEVNGSAYLAPQPGSYYCVVTSPAPGLCSKQSNTINITQVNYVAPVISVSGNICNGTPATITAEVTPGGTTFVWYRNNSYYTATGSSAPLPVTTAGTYKLRVYYGPCEIYSNELVVSEGHVVSITGSNAICPNPGSTVVLNGTPQGEGYAYQWFKDGAAVTTNGNAQTLTATAAGVYSLQVDKDGCSGTATHTVTTKDVPAAITSVAGLLTNFPDQTNLIEINGSADATSFEYSTNASVTPAASPVSGRKVYLSANTVGSNTISVTPYKDGCAGSPYQFNFVVISPLKELPNVLPPDVPVNLIGKSDGYFHLDKHINNYPGCISQHKSVTVQIKLDMGNTFNMGSHVFTGSAAVDIEAYYDMPGVTQTWPVTLNISNTTINNSAPEQIFVKQIIINPDLLKFIRIVVKSHSASTSAALAHLRLWASYSETYDVNVQEVNTILLSPVNNEHLNNNKWEQTFSWQSCADVTGYMVQLVRLFGTNTTPTAQDWSNALSIYREGTGTTATISLAEGSINQGEGYYWWRVTPIGNLENGLANPLNWGSPSQASRFTYAHPEDNKNWIYSRTFTEDNSIHEQVVYANGLQQVAQQQTRLQEENHVVASQTMQDYVGRNALTSLPIPTGRQNLSYIDGLLKAGANPFRITDFDADGKQKAPTIASDFSGYYSGFDNGFNARVANAEGYPYTRTLFAADGRVAEQSGVGLVHSMAGGKTVKTYYSNPSEGELIRVMGAEAPQATSVVKITTIDANGTGSITYQTKDGKVIATALTLPASPQLTPIGSVTAKTISETVRSFERIDERTIVSRKPLFYSEANQSVSIDYEINPTQLATLCQADQFGDPVAPCQTCDYGISIMIYKEGDATPISIGTGTIQAGTCGQVSGWNPAPVIFQPQAGVNYMLEKRITLNNKVPDGSTTYLEQHYKAIETMYKRRFNTSSTLGIIEDAFESGDYQLVKNMFGSLYRADLDQYVIDLGTESGACLPTVITIPNFDVCEDESVVDCKINGLSYWDYFSAYTGVEEPGTAIYFNNRLTGTQMPYTKEVFDAMIANLIADNGLTCEAVWAVWMQEVKGYEANVNRDLNVNTGDMGEDGDEYAEDAAQFGSVTAKPYSILESFFSSLDAMLQAQLEPEEGSESVNICSSRGSHYYFIKRNQLYGKIGNGNSNVVQPPLQYAYSLIYFDIQNDVQCAAMKFYSEYTNGEIETTSLKPTLSIVNGTVTGDFISKMDDCERYKFSNNSDMPNAGGGLFNEADYTPEGLADIKDKCNTACESREEEFRQAIIHSLMSTNAGTVIEFYHTYEDAFQGDKWVGVLDSTLHISDYTLSNCGLETMVTKVVDNCKNNYCNTTLTPVDTVINGKEYRTYGTYEERLKIKKVLTYDFNIEVGQACVDGDYILEGAGGQSNSVQVGDNSILLNQRLFSKGGGWPISAVDNQGNVIYQQLNDDGISFSLVKQSGTSSEIYWTYNLQNYAVSLTIDSESNIVFVFYLNNQLCLAKINSNGVLIWSNSTTLLDNSGSPSAFYCTIDPLDNIYITSKATWDIDFSSESELLVSAALVKYDKELNYQWHVVINGNYSNDWIYANPLVITKAGEALFMCRFSSAMEIQSSSGLSYIDVPQYMSLLLLKFNQEGDLVLNRVFKNLTTNYTFIQGFSAGENKSIYLFGRFEGEFDADPSTLDFILSSNTDDKFLIKLDENGNLLWANQFHDESLLTLEYSTFFTFDQATNEVVLVWTQLGDINSYLDFNLDADKEFLVNQGGFSVNVMKFSPFGSFVNGGRQSLPYIGSYGDSFTIMTGNVSNGIIYCVGRFASVNSDNGSFFLGMRLHANKYDSCSHPSLCFRFTDPRNYTITIPENMTDYVFEAKEIPCAETQKGYLLGLIEQQKEQLIQAEKDKFRDTYFNTCADPSKIVDKLTLTYTTGIHHFTLYYYDRAGNLIRTVPPEGVAELDVSTPANISSIREGGTVPAHLMVTEYQYNSLGQLVREHSPDGTPKPNNLTERPTATATAQQLDDQETYYNSMIYNSIGQVRFSRNALQKETGLNGTYSYTKYDELGRIIEVGEATGFNYTTLFSARDEKGTGSFPINGPETVVTQVTRTYYSEALHDTDFAAFQMPAGYTQRNLTNRVSFSVLDEDGVITTAADNILTAYSYDVHGNVEWLVQFIPGLGTGQIDARVVEYSYDLLSGKVKQVTYSPGQPDQFMHRYEYDASNRLKKVYTSTNGELWETEARYSYYLHGPLKRMVLGEDEVQGVDYTYTIHGWLKALNHPNLDKTTDPGQDAVGTTSVTGRDIFGMALGYYKGDYQNTTNTAFNSVSPDPAVVAGFKNLYNGNISSWGSNTASWINPAIDPHKGLYPNLASTSFRSYVTQIFTYDELNRLLTSNLRTGTGFVATSYYRNSYTYSANGNLLTAQTWRQELSAMDYLAYKYPTYNSRPLNNRLQQVVETAAASSFADDVEAGQAVDNYQYDAIGNIVRDKQQKTKISWTPYGKVKRVDKTDVNGDITGDYVAFRYDAAGNRVVKTKVDVNGVKHHFYVRDASGNIMAVYEREERAGIPPETKVMEIPIYGSDRLGVYKASVSLNGELVPLLENEIRIGASMEKTAYENTNYLLNPAVTLTLEGGFSFTSTTTNGTTSSFTVRVAQAQAGAANAEIYTRRVSNRQYELKDHLGNMRAVVSDLKLSTFTGTTPGNFEPLMQSMANYYPFGMDMPGRMWNDQYRYGFNGKEKDNEGEWGSTAYDYGFRIYNPSIGRFLSVDPLTKSYPMLTPYQFASNMPIAAIDVDGLESLVTIIATDGTKTTYTASDDVKVIDILYKAFSRGTATSVWEKGWTEYSGIGGDRPYPIYKGHLTITLGSDGQSTFLSYDPNWVAPPHPIAQGFRSLGHVWTRFWTSDEEGPRVARKYTFGIVGLATGVGAIAELTIGGVIFGSADVIIAGNDMYSAGIDQSDNADIDIDLIKDALIEKLGPEAGTYFEAGKVVIGAYGFVKGAKDTKVQFSLKFSSKEAGQEFVKTFGGALGLIDDTMDLLDLRGEVSGDELSNQKPKK